MATWNGFISNDFRASINWEGFILPDQDSAVFIDGTGAGVSLNPTLLAGQSASVFTLDQSALSFSVEGNLSIDSGASLSSLGFLFIGNTGTVTLSPSGNGLAVTGGNLINFGTLDSTLQVSGGVVDNSGAITGAVTISGGILNNFDTLGSTLQVSGGTVNNRGVITGAVTVSDGSLTLGESSNLSDSAVLTVNTGGTVNVDAFDVIGGLAGDGGTVQISNGNGLNIIGAANTAFSGVISGEGFLQFEGTGTRTLSGTNTYSGGTFIDGGTLQVGAGGGAGTLGSGAVVNNGALVFDRSDLRNL